jgi:hypothetical protein
LEGGVVGSCQWYNPFSYGNCASNVAKSVAGDAFHSIAESFGSAADHAVNWLWSQMDSATAVHLGGKGFGLEIGITGAIAGTVAVGLFAIQIIQSVLRREPGGLARAGKGLLIAFLGGAVAIAVVNLLLGATDALCNGIVKVATGTNIAGLGKLVLGSTALTGSVTGSAALLLLSLACIAATVIVYVALVVRKVLIVVTAIFAPIAFAGSLADITVSWTRRWIETTIALIASKLILVIIFVAGYGILIEGVGQSGSGVTQKVTQVISGILVLFVAGLAPWLALKVVHFTGDHAQQLHSLGSSAVGGVAAGGRAAQKAAPYVARAAAMPAGGGAMAGGAAAGAGGGGAGGAAGAAGSSGGAPGLNGSNTNGANANGSSASSSATSNATSTSTSQTSPRQPGNGHSNGTPPPSESAGPSDPASSAGLVGATRSARPAPNPPPTRSEP